MTLITIISTIAGVGTAIGVWKKLLAPYFRRLKKEKEKREEHYNKLAYVYNEMQVDGNGSMKTAVVNLRDSFGRVEIRLDGIELRLGNIDETQKISLNLQNVAYWISNDDGGWEYISPALCKIMGRSESELTGNNWLTWIDSADRKRVADAWKFSTENKAAFDEVFYVGNKKVWCVAFPKTSNGKMGKMVVMEEAKKVTA